MNLRDLTESDAGYTKVEDGRGEYRYLTTAETIQLSQAISLKRIADALNDGGSAFLAHLGGVLSDASHDHAQRMR